MTTLAHNDIEENFKFVVLEVKKQVEDTLKAIEAPSISITDRIRERDDYIDNLKSVIENKSFSRIFNASISDQKEIDFLRALLTITSNLEKIGDYSVNIGGQLRYLKIRDFIKEYDYRSFYDELFAALNLIVKAFYKQDVKLALRVCRAELSIDVIYKRNLNKILGEMNTQSNSEDLITTLFIFQYLERMGDALLNIGEAIIFSVMGEKIKIREYKALENSLANTSLAGEPMNELNYNGIWGTRSGCKIGSINNNGSKQSKLHVFFKHGKLKKLKEEKVNIELWEKRFPGLAPKVFAFQKDRNSAALLLEYLKGHNLQEIILNAEKKLFKKAFSSFLATTSHVWSETISQKKTNSKFILQIASRIDDVYRLHPQLKNQANRIGGLQIPSLEELLKKAVTIETEIDAPFSIFIHGDFNTNNIIYNPTDDKTHYIDLHRSRHGDFAQDVSVFMVSNFRLPVFGPEARDRLNSVMRDFFHFSIAFAKENNDPTFQARLALGLVRSFITSIRYEYRSEFAKIMFLRGVYILGKVIAHHEDADKKSWESFSLSEESFIY